MAAANALELKIHTWVSDGEITLNSQLFENVIAAYVKNITVDIN